MGKRGKHTKNRNIRKKRKLHYNEQIINSKKRKLENDLKENISKDKKNSKVKNIFSNLFLIIFIICIFISVYEIIDWTINNKKTSEIRSSIENVVTINNDETIGESEKYNVDFEKLKGINSNTIGWLKVHGTDVEYPVVQGKDNSFYLNHSFDKKYNPAGWIFADYNNQFDEKMDKNTVIYGHNRRDGSMFCTLKNILKPEWYENEENKKIIFITENEKIIYETFSVYEIEEELYYVTTDFSSETKYQKFIDTVKSRSIVDFGVEINTEDEILTLSTCANNNKYRVVLHAKRIK